MSKRNMPEIFRPFDGDTTCEINRRELDRAMQVARDRAREFKLAQRAPEQVEA